MLELRFDRGGITSPTPKADGTVIYSGRAARTGDHEYPWGTERRDADELRRITNQLKGAPVVTPHPTGLIREGAPANVVGEVTDAWVDGDHVSISFRVDAAGDEAIKSGANQLSLGYQVESGRGEPHRGTTVDHVALVPFARCGPTCSIRTDNQCPCDNGAQACPCASPVPDLTLGKKRAIFNPSPDSGENMSDTDRTDKLESENKILQATITSLEAQRDQASARADSLQKQVDDLKERTDSEEVETLNAKVAELTEQVETEKARADAAEDPEQRRKDIAARVKLETSALAALGETGRERFDGKTDREIMVEVAEKHGARIDSDKSDDYVSARFDAVVEACDQARADSDEDPDKQRREDVAARVKLETSALAALGETDRERFDGKTDREVMVDVIKSLNETEIDSDKSDDYVRARFDAAVERFHAGHKALANMRRNTDPNPGARSDATQTAREKMIEANRNAWKRPTAKA